MSLYLNRELKPKVFKKNLDKLKISSNQTLARINFINEFIQQQHNLNSQLVTSYDEINKSIEQSNTDKNHQFDIILKQLKDQEEQTKHFIDGINDQEAPIKLILQRLEQVEKTNQNLQIYMNKEEVVSQAIMDQLTFQDQVINRISRQLEELETTYKSMIVQQNNSTELYNAISKQLAVQEAFHQTILEQIDQHKSETKELNSKLGQFKDQMNEKISFIFSKFESLAQTFFIRVPKKEKEKINKD
jgi:chromosome segregation ATPase